MPWVIFDDRATFDAWHNDACATRGIPRPGRNGASDAPEIMACWTNAWVDPFSVGGGDPAILATVSDDEAASLNPVDVTVDELTGAMSMVRRGTTDDPKDVSAILDDSWRAAKPPTVTIDGVTWDTATGEILP